MVDTIDLEDVLVLYYDCGNKDLQNMISFIKENGVGIYSIDHDRGIFSICKESFATLEDLRADVEEDDEDYFKEFNDEDPEEGYLYGETFFSVHITEINEGD
jgi:hypothetical protein